MVWKVEPVDVSSDPQKANTVKQIWVAPIRARAEQQNESRTRLCSYSVSGHRLHVYLH